MKSALAVGAIVCALAAPAVAYADASLPRFEGRGSASLSFIAGSDGPDDAAIAREVARNGFYAGAPVVIFGGSSQCATYRALSVKYREHECGPPKTGWDAPDLPGHASS